MRRDGAEWADVMLYFRSHIHPPLLLIVPEEESSTA